MAGTDRHNFLQMLRSDLNFPAPFENTTFWDMVESVNYPKATDIDLAIGFATSGYYCGKLMEIQCDSTWQLSNWKQSNLSLILHTYPRSIDEGPQQESDEIEPPQLHQVWAATGAVQQVTMLTTPRRKRFNNNSTMLLQATSDMYSSK